MEEQTKNLATYLMLPLIELTEESFGENENNFVNCYITNEGYIAVEVKDWTLVPTKSITTIYYFTDFELKNDNHMIIFRVTGNFVEDVNRFRRGEYSKFSQNAKDRIIIFYNLEETDYFVRLLNADIKLRKEIAKDLEVSLDFIKEVKSSPHESNFIDFTDFLPLQIDDEQQK